MMRRETRIALFCLALLGYEACAEADAQRLRIYNWSDYIAPDAIAQFEAETGISVTLETFHSSEILMSKILGGQLDYDLIVPSNDTLPSAVTLNAVQRLNPEWLTNLNHLDQDLTSLLSTTDPDSLYGVPYLWGTTGMGVNVDRVLEILGPDAPINSLALIFDPQYAQPLSQCGITLLDSPTEVLPMALSYLGIERGTQNRTAFKRVDELLASIYPYIQGFESNANKYPDALIEGESCVVLGYSGDLISAEYSAKERGMDVRYTIPAEGAELWFDMLAIPTNAENVENAHKFINFLLRPEVIAKTSNYLAFANANASATRLVDPAIRENPNIYPSSEVRERLSLVATRPLTVQRNMTRSWTLFKNAVLSN